MREADIDDVLYIERGAYAFPWSEGIFRDCLRVGYSCWVLEDGGAMVGYGIMSVGAGESHILNLCIGPGEQGRGLGRYLLEHLLAVARDHHARTTMLEVRPSNAPALRLYNNMGFNEVGVRRGYYPDRHGREDALVLALELLPA
jgi:ribosomal-protein-alanine N-acetyltransferase